METICGADCTNCPFNEGCMGCFRTQGKPFGGDCVVAKCCLGRGYDDCSQCKEVCELEEKFCAEINDLHIEGMPQVKKLYELKGAFVNLEYEQPNGEKIKYLQDTDIYFGAQLEKPNDERCFGVVVDEKLLLVCEYGENGSDAKLLYFKQKQ